MRARQPGLEATGQEGGPQSRSRESAGRTCVAHAGAAGRHLCPRSQQRPCSHRCPSQSRGGHEQVANSVSCRKAVWGGGTGQQGHRLPPPAVLLPQRCRCPAKAKTWRERGGGRTGRGEDAEPGAQNQALWPPHLPANPPCLRAPERPRPHHSGSPCAVPAPGGQAGLCRCLCYFPWTLSSESCLLCSVLISCQKDVGQIGFEPTLLTSFSLNHFFMDPASKYIHSSWF